jgi:ABC-type Fe3+ transport system permease subunit
MFPRLCGAVSPDLRVARTHSAQSSRSLARSRQTFLRIILPLSVPGLLAGATFAFVLSLGDFLVPLLLGGPSGIMISNIVVSLFGAAISLCMLALVLGLIFFSERWKRNRAFREFARVGRTPSSAAFVRRLRLGIITRERRAKQPLKGQSSSGTYGIAKAIP